MSWISLLDLLLLLFLICSFALTSFWYFSPNSWRHTASLGSQVYQNLEKMADSYIHRPSFDGKARHDPEKTDKDYDRRISIVTAGEVVNASGYRDQLQRHYGLISICGLALTIDNAWVALGGSIAVSISMSISTLGNGLVLKA